MAQTIYDVEAGIYIAKLSSKLKEMPEFKMPEWAYFVKTSAGKERPPEDAEWWYIRAASILRQIYIKGTVGSGRLSIKFGTRQQRGMRPAKFHRASRKIIRNMLQAAEKVGFLEKVKEGRAGRRLTKKGKQFMDEVAQ